MGLKVIGGKMLPGTDGELGAYVAAVYRPAMVETMGQVKEGKHSHTLEFSDNKQ